MVKMKQPPSILQGRMNSFSRIHTMHFESPLPGAGPMEGYQVVVLGEVGVSRDLPSLGSPATSQSPLQEPLMQPSLLVW